jgi:hypothetical protein
MSAIQRHTNHIIIKKGHKAPAIKKPMEQVEGQQRSVESFLFELLQQFRLNARSDLDVSSFQPIHGQLGVFIQWHPDFGELFCIALFW